MTDYTRGTGGAGTMLIRDLGYEIQFHIHSGYSATYANQLPYNWYANGASGSGTVKYPSGSPWVYVKSIYVSTTQDIKFGIGNTGTSGFGGPTDFWVHIDRASVPAAPNSLALQANSRTFTSFGVTYARGSNNGAGIDQDNAEWSRASDGVVVWNDATFGHPAGNPNGLSNPAGVGLALVPGETYRVRIQSHNAVGWGPFSGYFVYSTYPAVWVKLAGVWKRAIPWVKVSGVWKMTLPWVKVSGTWKRTG